MSRYIIKPHNQQQGFALLTAIIVSVIILTIGLSILSTTLKQQVLTDIGQESERAFHAAYAGVECAQFWNIGDVWDVATGTATIQCVDQAVTTQTVFAGNTTSFPQDGATNAHEIKTAQFDWQSAGTADGTYTYDMCTQLTVYKYYDPSSATNMLALPIPDPSTPLDPNSLKTCNIGVECTVVEARGYNRSCANLADVRTVEREITVRF